MGPCQVALIYLGHLQGNGDGKTASRYDSDVAQDNHVGALSRPAPTHGRSSRETVRRLTRRERDDTDCYARPNGGEQLLLGHEPAGMGHQVVQHCDGLGLQGDCLRAMPEVRVIRLKTKGTETPLGGVIMARSPCLPKNITVLSHV